MDTLNLKIENLIFLTSLILLWNINDFSRLSLKMIATSQGQQVIHTANGQQIIVQNMQNAGKQKMLRN